MTAERSETTLVMVDVDTGIDDSLALLFLLASPDAEIVGIASTAGNVPAPQVAANNLAWLDVARAGPIPVAVGSLTPLVVPLVTTEDTHGPQGIGYAELPASARSLDARSAAELWVDVVRAHPGEVIGLVTGPLTNLALALKREPELPLLLRRLVVMGGAFHYAGNTTPTAEWNVSVDPEAAKVVFDAFAVVPAERVVRHDGDDTYLVVAADKGTATFSDLANSIAREYGFWLDDAFASGGSIGYDHKGMGITARGAWESVKRHFRELGLDTQTEDFTVVGVGDMSGDVFGNGMLLSEHIRLVAAFDHRHIFIDPAPDAATSYAERRRLFELPRSSWGDYDTGLISAGGGVFSRGAKSIRLTDEIREGLGLPADTETMTPAELMKAVLQAPVDLLWNGGIGTYVKASTENNAQIGDRANDAIRVDGSQLRVKVVGEGGNLGFSQLGRIEAALGGVRINTDAIDNSAGVDTSDHEVNIKILLTGLMREDDLTLKQRNELLVAMTQDVGLAVLRDNYEQNVLLGNARAQDHQMLGVHRRFMDWLTGRGELDRALEFLPDDATLEERAAQGRGLSSPEFSVLVAYAKLALKADLVQSKLPDEPWFHRSLAEYFPEPIRERFPDELDKHPLRREIIVNSVANSIINRGGITFIYRAMEETGASCEQVARAFVVAREVFDLASFVAEVEALDNVVPTAVQTKAYLEFRRLLDRSVRWFLQNRPSSLDVAAEIERFGPHVAATRSRMADLLGGPERERMERDVDTLEEAGVGRELAVRIATLLDVYSCLDIVEIAAETGRDLEEITPMYFAVSEYFEIDSLLFRVAELAREDRWDSLARGAMRDDLYAVLDSLTRAVLESTDPELDARDRLAAWVTENTASLERTKNALIGIDSLTDAGLAPLSVALRSLRSIVRAGSATT